MGKHRRLVGRPTIYTFKIAEKLCLLIATTPQGLEHICKHNRDLPRQATIYRWLQTHPEFRERYALAREQQGQILFDQIVDIADTPKEGATVITRGGWRERRVGDMTEHRRLQIDARKWVLSKLLPKKYGDRIEVDSTSDPLAELLAEMKKESDRLGPPEGQ
jgi:terminase small subunit-like protein